MDWQALGTALALVFVIEGLLPFANPEGARRACAALATAEPKVFRWVGGLSILSGLGLLIMVRS